jgi:tetratricopeptide (TPR) repeat protein
MAEIQLEQAPRKAKEHFDKGFQAFERANYDYAMDFFQLALEVCPQLTRARKFLRMAQVRKFKAGGKSGGLADAMSSLSGIGGVMAVGGLIKKDPAKAVIKVEELLRKNPLNPQFIKLAVDAALAAQLPEAAVVTLETFIENKPGDIETMRRLGKLYQDIERFHEAREIYEAVLQIKPTDPKSIKDLKDASALDSMQRGNWESKGSFHDKLKNKDEAVSLERQSKAVKSEKDTDALIEETKAKIIREPANINYQRTLAKLLLDSNRFEEGIEVLEKANQATGGADPQIDRALSDAKLRKMDYDIVQLKNAGRAEEASALEQQKAGFLLADAEDRVKRYPNDLLFKFELGVLQFDRGLINEAIGQFQLSQRNPQRRNRSLYYLARCFREKGQNDIAAEQLVKAKCELVVMDETKKDIVYELGCVYEATGSIDKALEQFKEIYSVDIGYRDVTQKIEKYYKK